MEEGWIPKSPLVGEHWSVTLTIDSKIPSLCPDPEISGELVTVAASRLS